MQSLTLLSVNLYMYVSTTYAASNQSSIMHCNHLQCSILSSYYMLWYSLRAQTSSGTASQLYPDSLRISFADRVEKTFYGESRTKLINIQYIHSSVNTKQLLLIGLV